MNKRNEALVPRFLTEDYLAVSRLLVGTAWLLVIGAVLVRAWVLLDPDGHWPTIGGFDVAFRLVVLEMSVTAILLTTLLLRRGWLDRVPRESLDKVRQLCALIALWLIVHLWLAFHMAGGLSGPFLPLVPLVPLALCALLSTRQALVASAVWLLGLAMVVGLGRHGILMTPGALAGHFRLGDTLQLPGLVALGLQVGVAVLLGWRLLVRYESSGESLHRANRCDAHSGLFTHAFLQARVAPELRRSARQERSTMLMLIEMSGLSEYAGSHGFDAARELVRRAAAALVEVVRPKLDTPARYGATTLAVLMPTADAEAAETIARRIRERIAERAYRDADAVHLCCVSVVCGPGGTGAGELIEVAERALAEAVASGDGFRLVQTGNTGA